MKKNMGTVDRTLRLIAVAAIAVLYFTGAIGGTLAAVLGVIALAFLVTSLVGSCPAYLPLKFSTRKEAPGPPPAA